MRPETDTRSRIVSAASRLIAEGGLDAATTRAIAAAAEVQAPTIYRIFGDKDGVLEAVADQAMADYVAREKLRQAVDDPVEELRHAWDVYMAFSVAHPTVFRLVYTPQRQPSSVAFVEGLKILRERVRRVARAGRLRVTEEQAVDMIHAMGTGAALMLLQKPAAERAGLSEAAREAVNAAILTHQRSAPKAGPASAATALRADLESLECLSPGERLLMAELLVRIARS